MAMEFRFALRVTIMGHAVAMCLGAVSTTCSAESTSFGSSGSCVLPGQFVLRGPDGQVFGEFNEDFLRENTEEAFDLASHQRIGTASIDVKVLSSYLLSSGPDESPRFRISFSDGHEGTFRLPVQARARWSPEHELSARPRQLWGAPHGANDSAKPANDILKELGSGGMSRFSYDALCGPNSSLEMRVRWAEVMHIQGISVIDRMPPTEDASITFANCTASYVYPSVYGYRFEIKSVDQANNLAFTSHKIQQHTDLPFYSTPPGIQLFHCLVPAIEGGESTFLDGFHAASVLHEHDPEAFKTLSEHRLRFFDLTEKWHLSALHRTFQIDDNVDGDGTEDYAAGQAPKLRRVVFNERARDSWRHWDPSHNEQFSKLSRALKAYERIVDDDARYVTIGLQAGEMVATDNFRVMHGRNQFRGGRHYQGAYIDWDALYASWRAAAASYDVSEEHHRHL